MEYTREIELNVEPSSVIPVVRVKQGDASFRFIRAKLMAGDNQLIPEAGTTVVFREEKPDGTGVMLDSSLTDPEYERALVVINNDGTITVELIEQTTTCPGRCMCDLCLIKDEKIISTISFAMEVFRSPVTDNLEESSTDFRTLVNALELIQNYLDGVDADDRYY